MEQIKNRLISDIKKALKDKDNVKVPINTMARVLIGNEKIDDNTFTKRLLKFSKDNSLDYVIILGSNSFVRFWGREYGIKQLEQADAEEKENAIHNAGNETIDG